MSAARCYGEWSRRRTECRSCPVAGYCREARAEGPGRYRERTRAEVAAALAEYAALPTVYEDETGSRGETWGAVKRFLVFLVSLHPHTLRVLQEAFNHPGWSRSQLADAVGISEKRLNNVISGRRELAAALNQNKGKIMQTNTAPIQPTDNVYLSGPMAGQPENNEPAFHAAEELIQKKFPGCNVINPVYLSNLMGFQRTREDYLKVAAELVRTSSVIVLLPGWQNSAGAMLERSVAIAAGLRIVKLEDLNHA